MTSGKMILKRYPSYLSCSPSLIFSCYSHSPPHLASPTLSPDRVIPLKWASEQGQVDYIERICQLTNGVTKQMKLYWVSQCASEKILQAHFCSNTHTQIIERRHNGALTNIYKLNDRNAHGPYPDPFIKVLWQIHISKIPQLQSHTQ